MANKSFQVALEAATNENNTEENWDRILGKNKTTTINYFFFEINFYLFQRFVIMLKMVK
jgi:hypothetical protein